MYFFGVDIGGMSVKIGLISETGELLRHLAIPTEPQKGYLYLTDAIVKTCAELAEAHNLSPSDLGGLGAGVPGTANSETGIVTVAANIGWKNVPFGKEINKRLNVPVKISNDANCAALGEQRFGSGNKYKDIVFITIGTGVGSGIIADGKLIEGVGCAGGESGHMVIEMEGIPCNCGRSGCWEKYASASALISQSKRAMENFPDSLMHDLFRETGKVDGRTAFIASGRGDAAAQLVVKRYIKYVAVGLINLGNILHPEAFIIGGGVSAEGDSLIKPLQKYIDNYCYGSGLNPPIAVIKASLGNRAGMLGAAALVMGDSNKL